MAILDREKIKRAFPFLAETVRYGKKRKNELSALNRHLTRKKYQKNNAQINQEKIKVVFICQYVPAWSKNKQLYETLKKDEKFEVALLCVPNRISANKLDDPEDLSNDTFEYFNGHGYQESINALVGKNSWFDLKEYHPTYVIYNRYDRPMPIQYTSTEVSCYAKIVFIHYGLALMKSGEQMIDIPFMANTYCFFAESKGIRDYFLSWNRILCKLQLSHAYFCGIAAVENAYKARNDVSPAWDFSRNGFRIIYAPRWTMDALWGGSTFPKYKELFISLADRNPDMDILIRPHPLMFDHFIEQGIMSREEVNTYKTSCEERNNIRVDKEKEYLATFWHSSALICDFSSTIVEYFITGKPIIYLTYNERIDYTDQMKAILDCCYCVNNEEELCKVINDLKNGYDPLADRRKEICKAEFSDSYNASERMKHFLIDGYHE